MSLAFVYFEMATGLRVAWSVPACWAPCYDHVAEYSSHCF